MRAFRKNDAPEQFELWKATDCEDLHDYTLLRNPLRQEVLQSLLVEQGWTCCYCGRRIAIHECHIEHFRPQRYRELCLDYSNLMASCNPEYRPNEVPVRPLHCGHAKAGHFDEERIISPLEVASHRRFIYAYNGEILTTSATDEQAAYMLDLLQLEIARFNNGRRRVLELVFDPDFIAAVSVAELQALRNGFSQHDELGHFEDFGHVVVRFAEQLINVAPARS